MENLEKAPVVISSAHAMFGTDKNMEKNGIILDYDDFWLRIARAGGANTRYNDVLKHKFKPHRRAIQTETLSDAKADALVLETFAETVILGGGCKAYGEGFLVAADGSKLQITRENLITYFGELPDLFADVKEQAGKISLFRKEVLETDAKN